MTIIGLIGRMPDTEDLNEWLKAKNGKYPFMVEILNGSPVPPVIPDKKIYGDTAGCVLENGTRIICFETKEAADKFYEYCSGLEQ